MMFALGVRYLTGYAVATDVSDRALAEWPPHPARIFMALAAAHFETDGGGREREALEWLERQGVPALRASAADLRDVVTHYVPVNDAAVPTRVRADAKPKSIRAGLAVLPSHRPKQGRAFPRVRPHEDTVYLVWPESKPDAACRASLESLCEKVTRIGHSSSFVQMWVEESPPEANLLPDASGDIRLRVIGEGVLGYLETQYNSEAVVVYAELKKRLGEAEGKSRKAIQAEIDRRFPHGEPTSLRPVISLWQPYRPAEASRPTGEPASGAFARDLLVLAVQEGPVVGLETTWSLLTALRDTILTTCDPTPEWLSGHQADGSPSEAAHLALLPLAFVGHPHADGHLLGVGLAFPKDVRPRERGAGLRGLFYDAAGRAVRVVVRLGPLGTWAFVRETRNSPPLALRSSTWTGPARTWATITPLVLDRHPKADYRKERAQWHRAVAAVIGESCTRQGLPVPIGVEVGRTSWHRGVPRAVPGKTGFALMPTKRGQHARQQVHARLTFAEDIEGPLLLGAGRYRGYGVCKPLDGGTP